MAKITIRVTPVDAEELVRITAALAPFAAEAPKAEAPKAVPPTKPARSTGQTSSGGLGSREALLDAMRSAMKAGKRAAVVQVLAEFGAARATELKDEDVAAATAMVVAL